MILQVVTNWGKIYEKIYCGCSYFKPPVSHWVTFRDQHTYGDKIKALYGPKWHIDRMFHSQIHSLYEGIGLSNMPNPPCIHGSTHQKFRPSLMHRVTHISSSWLFISSCKTKQNVRFATKKLPQHLRKSGLVFFENLWGIAGPLERYLFGRHSNKNQPYIGRSFEGWAGWLDRELPSSIVPQMKVGHWGRCNQRVIFF